MPVIPYRLDRLQNQKDLAQFLHTFQQTNFEKSSLQIASISLEINPVDPLAVLQAIGQPHQRHFYFEKAGKESILAIETAIQLEFEGEKRFYQAKQFIHDALKNITHMGLNAPFSGAHFFCNFSFFDQVSQEAVFPAASVFLPRWQIVRRGNRCTVTANIEVDRRLDPDTIAHQIWKKLQVIQGVQYEAIDLRIDHKKLLTKQDVSPTGYFKTSVASALELIYKKHFHKIVLAHALDVTSPIPFNLISSLNNLRKLYPNCYIFSTSNSTGQTFVGASPERLVSLHNQRLETDALAGSAPRGKTAIEDAQFAHDLLSSVKETHEHQVVIDSIAQHLSHLGLQAQCSPARLLRLPNIQHLHTPIRANVPAGVHLLDVVAELHPTPAVAGAPRTVACEQIRRYEQFERSLYAAPIGWVDHQGNGEFAVGIRSALLDGCQARLFAGAGIVAGSNPEKELNEVQLKLQALLRALV
ncbi:MAG: isochorismate synthase [Leptolyngbyaceae cyanobacterium CSU_1_3]|nr:isochorismate synthase [Leptolyngbyaceae cyanobacterium CSU_1_3]